MSALIDRIISSDSVNVIIEKASPVASLNDWLIVVGFAASVAFILALVYKLNKRRRKNERNNGGFDSIRNNKPFSIEF